MIDLIFDPGNLTLETGPDGNGSYRYRIGLNLPPLGDVPRGFWLYGAHRYANAQSARHEGRRQQRLTANGTIEPVPGKE